MTYTVGVTETFEREFKKKHRDKIEWLKKIKEKLQSSPEYGKPLKGRLYGIWQIRIESFRVRTKNQRFFGVPKTSFSCMVRNQSC